MLLQAAPASWKSASAKRRFFTRNRTSSKPILTESVLSSTAEVGGSEEEERNASDTDAEGRAPGWTAAGGAAVTAGGGNGDGDGDGANICMLHRRPLSGQREIIASTLVRETEDCSPLGETSRQLQPTNEVAKTATRAVVPPPTERGGEHNDPSRSNGTPTVDMCESADVRPKTATETHEDPFDASHEPKAERRMSSLNKLWPSGLSSGRGTNKNTAATTPAVPSPVAPDADTEKTVVTQTAVSGMSLTNGGGRERRGGLNGPT